MAAKQLFESLKVDLTCPICSGCFTDPVVIKCGHVFCGGCIFLVLKEAVDADRAGICPACGTVLAFTKVLKDWRLWNLAVTGKMLESYVLQSIRGLTTCDKHNKEENLFCEHDLRPLCGPCFLSTEHKEHKVLPLEKAASQRLAQLQELWTVLRDRKEKFENDLENEKERGLLCKDDNEDLRHLVASKFEKLHQFCLEEEQLHLQRLDQEASASLPTFENKARLCQQIHSLRVMIFKAENNFEGEEMPKSLDMQNNLSRKKDEVQIELECRRKREAQEKLEGQATQALCGCEEKCWLLFQEEEMLLQSLDQEARDNLAMFEQSKARLSKRIHDLQMVMSEIEDNFEKPFIEMLQDGRRTLGKREELLFRDPELACPRWTTLLLPSMKELLKTSKTIQGSSEEMTLPVI